MADQIVLTNLAGQVVWVNNRAFPTGIILQFGNFPRVDQNVDEPGFEPSAQYNRDGFFQFSGAQVSVGQTVLFDVALGQYAAYATNLRVQ